ncbi:MAG: nucleotidyl transferase AbiEii/AbiGii toxin family protein [Candidatus Ancillula sp.]|jgi:hypothetical protein|nr:nucleotidyl transferase AbiEii/AbiGii toxin family protein [Candidatus Ancillula sp.]
MESKYDVFAKLKEREKEPQSVAIIDRWVNDASRELGMDTSRVSWMLASTIVISALNRATNNDGSKLFLLKGGVLLQKVFSDTDRTTSDVDSLFRGTYEDFLKQVDEIFKEPIGTVTLERSDIEVIKAPKLIKPVRFYVRLKIKGKPWRKVKVEISFPEGKIAEHVNEIPANSTKFFGLKTASELATISMDYQVAQKIHGASTPHNPPAHINDRVRDIVDLMLIKKTFYPASSDLSGVRNACVDIFAARKDEAEKLGMDSLDWPPVIKSNDVWARLFPRYAESVGLTKSLDECIGELNEWIGEIDK